MVPFLDLPLTITIDAAREVEGMRKQTQVMIDMVFSFAEPGFQELETSKDLSGILEKAGFAIERGVGGMPTAMPWRTY